MISALALAAFAALGTALVAFVQQQTHQRIVTNRHEDLLRKLHAILPERGYDNDLLNSKRMLAADQLDSEGAAKIYLARAQNTPVAAIFDWTTPHGYGGPIRLLIGVRYADETVIGVRVLAQHETPGLGDAIERGRSDWITQFTGRSLGRPPRPQWRVEADGGGYDQITGATITSRSVVGAVRSTLVYFAAHKQTLFSGTLQDATQDGAAAGR